MSFLSILFLWSLPLTAVPVVVHLLNRRRREVISWGAMQFLQEARPRRWRILRLSDLLLMLLRALLLALLIFALARPLLRTRWSRSGAARDVVFVVDTSLSTSRRLNGQRAFDGILREARGLVDGLSDTDTLRVLATSPRRWILPIGVSISGETKREIRGRLEELSPTLASADMMACILDALDVEPSDGSAERLVVVLTDGAAHGWRTEAAGLWQAVRTKMENLPVKAAVRVVSVGDDASKAANLSIESLGSSRQLAAVGAPVTLTATIRNRGREAIGPAVLSWRAGDQALGVTTTVALEPDQATTAEIQHSFERPGVHEVLCEARCSDDVAPDNACRYVVEVVDRLPVLVVDSRPGERSMERTESGFLLAALGRTRPDPHRRWRSVFDAKVVSPAELPALWPEDYACVVLADVPRLGPKGAERLAAYARAGGGVWLALGNQADRTYLNTVLHQGPAGLLPLGLTEPVGDQSDRERCDAIFVPSRPHRAVALLADERRCDLDRARIYRRHCFDTRKQPKGVSVLMKTSRGAPLVLEKTVGRGRVIVQATPLNARWSNIPLLKAFVMMVHEYLWYLAEPAVPQRNLEPGEVLAARLPVGQVGDTARLHTPLGTTRELTGGKRGSKRLFSCSVTAGPGRYQLDAESPGGKTVSTPYWVRRNPAESDVRALEDAERKDLAAQGALTFGADPLRSLADSPSTAGTEPIWSWLLVALLALMLGEGLLAARMTRRRYAASAPAVMKPT